MWNPTILLMMAPTGNEVFRWQMPRILRVVHGRRVLCNVPGSFEEAPQTAYGAA